MAAFKSMLAAALMLSLATLALAKPPYLMVSYGICEDVEGMETISDEGVCQEAGIAIFGDAEKAFRAGQPTGGYRDLNGRPRGCSFAYGDDNISGDMLLFSVAPGDCGTYKLFGCICGSRSAPAATPAPSVEMTPVALGRAGDFVILSKSGITTVPPSVITGDIACSPIAGTAMTGFSFTADASNKFSTSAQLTGQAYAASFAAPTPATLTTAVLDMGIAYTDASQRVTTSPANLNINAGAISGLTFTPGVYKWDSAITFGGDIYIKGNRDSLFIFQTVSNIVAGTAAKVLLVDDGSGNGWPLAANIVWVSAGFLDVGTTAHVEGVFLMKTHAAFKTGSSLNGRVLVQTACTLDSTTIERPYT